MSIIPKVLITVVTRNNPALLQQAFESYGRFDPGYPCDYCIIDHESDDSAQINVLYKLSQKYEVVEVPNNRVEASFLASFDRAPDYEYYFFAHDDCIPHKNGWLKAFVDRMKSGYAEPIITNTHLLSLPIGRVGALTHPWRDYDTVLGYPVQCRFLRPALAALKPQVEAPPIFKYADSDRVLISRECMLNGSPLQSVANFEEFPELIEPLKPILDQYLPYRDEGMYPKKRYPEGFYWNRLTLLCEFLNSVFPLMNGFRTVGLDSDGYLEQVHGYDTPWGHNQIAHLGAPNCLEFLAKRFNTDQKEVKKRFKDRVFVMQSIRLVQQYYKGELS